jgi:hypothetical protein
LASASTNPPRPTRTLPKPLPKSSSSR